MIYLISGDSEYLIQSKLKEICLRFNDFETIKLDFNDKKQTLRSVIECCNTQDLFCTNKLVIVRNYQGFQAKGLTNEQEYKLFKKYLEHDIPEVKLVFITNYKPSKTKKMTKLIDKKNYFDCSVNHYNFKNQVKTILRQHNLFLDNNTFNMFCDRLNYNLDVCMQEVEKLQLYQDKLSYEVVDQLVAESKSEKIYLLLNSMHDHDVKKTLVYYHKLMAAKVEPYVILYSLALNYRQLLQLRYLYDHSYSQEEIKKAIGVPDFVFNNLLKNVKNKSSTYLLHQLAEIASLEQKTKTQTTNLALEVEMFIIKRI